MPFDLPDRARIEAAAEIVHAAMLPTPTHAWPLLAERTGTDIRVKHENHAPTGAFKVRGGLIHMRELKAAHPNTAGVVAATRGNHGQSIAFAARAQGLGATIVVPEGNSTEKNAAMRAFGAELVVHGHDFQAALEHAQELADARGLVMVPSFADTLVAGVASYGMELFAAAPGLDTLYVPIGLGSGIAACIAAREAHGLRTKIVGVVAEAAPAYSLSFAKGEPVSTNSADTMADGLACRVPVPDAIEIINRYAERVVTVSDDAIRATMRHYFTDTHNVAEGAGAAALAALLTERDAMAGKTVGVVLSGGNIDREVYYDVLGGGT